ncbi:MAG: hypothetical protein KAJ93_08150 [Methanosarcinales archaeon]|nr:hypothetical protein [Methanosarcinales archaeon]
MTGKILDVPVQMTTMNMTLPLELAQLLQEYPRVRMTQKNGDIGKVINGAVIVTMVNKK